MDKWEGDPLRQRRHLAVPVAADADADGIPLVCKENGREQTTSVGYSINTVLYYNVLLRLQYLPRSWPSLFDPTALNQCYSTVAHDIATEFKRIRFGTGEYQNVELDK